MRKPLLVFMTLALAFGQPWRVSAEDQAVRGLASFVPKDAVFACVAEGDQPSEASSSLGSIKAMLDGAYGLGLFGNLDIEMRCWLDSLTTYADVLTFSHAIALLDIKAQPRWDGGHELASMKLALIVDEKDRGDVINRRIQHLLNTYTNSNETKLSCGATADGEQCKLTDDRIPSWFVIEWGRVNGKFVATIGKDVFDQIAATIKDPRRGLGRDEWFAKARAATSIPKAPTVCYLNMTAVRPTLDPVLLRKVDQVLSVLGWSDVDRAILAFDRRDRFTVVEGAVQRAQGIQSFALIGPQFAPTQTNAIPDEATRIAAINCEPQALLNGVSDAYLAARSPRAREGIRKFWGDWQSEAKVSIEGDILEYLDRGVVIHDFPPHAFKLPFARTVMFRIKKDPKQLRENVDRLFNFIRQNPSWISPLALNRGDDGTWSINLGIEGPALSMTDEWLVLSFSPQAARLVVSQIKSDSGAAKKASEGHASR